MGTEYHRVPQDEDGVSPPTATFRLIQSRWKILAITSLTTNAILLLSIFTTLPTLSKKLTTQSPQSCLRQTSSFSPLLSETSLSLTTTTINGTLFPNTSPPSIWRSPPSPQVDTAWHNLSQTTPFAITHHDVVSLSRNPKTTFQIPPSYGFRSGPDSPLYLAELDGQHHLHCLNMLRKYAYLPIYFPRYTSTLTMPVFHQNHLTHCLDIIRQQLLCTFSTEVITYRWVRGQNIPQPDFSVQKQCKDLGVIRGWLEGKWDRLRLSEEQMVNVPRPVGVEGIDVEVEGSEYWDELVGKARRKGVDVHEYVDGGE